jgi:hypothetical protein
MKKEKTKEVETIVIIKSTAVNTHNNTKPPPAEGHSQSIPSA